ncbi:MAG: response regulator [Gammaproteobacteria bacterium]|nr:response regulator [Gammaproteobacteria bacterium]
MNSKAYLAPNEVADLLMVSPVTVRQWAQKGMLDAMLTAGGHRRFTMEEVERFAKERGLTLFRPENEKLRILIVDDNDQFVSTLKDVIKNIDDEIQIDTAKNGFAAGSKIHSFNPDVILLDIRMPGIDGIEVCRFIKETPATRSIRVIGMTGFPGNGTVEAVIDAGAEKCMTKPFGAGELMAALNLSVEAA